MGEQRHYRRPSQHKRRPPQTVMPCGPEDTPERQSEHRAETEKQPPRQPRKRLVQKRLSTRPRWIPGNTRKSSGPTRRRKTSRSCWTRARLKSTPRPTRKRLNSATPARRSGTATKAASTPTWLIRFRPRPNKKTWRGRSGNAYPLRPFSLTGNRSWNRV